MVSCRKGPGKGMLWLTLFKEGKEEKDYCEECPPVSRGELAQHPLNCRGEGICFQEFLCQSEGLGRSSLDKLVLWGELTLFRLKMFWIT